MSFPVCSTVVHRQGPRPGGGSQRACLHTVEPLPAEMLRLSAELITTAV